MPSKLCFTYYLRWRVNDAHGSQLLTAASPHEAWTTLKNTLRETYHAEPLITGMTCVDNNAVLVDIRDLLAGIIDAVGGVWEGSE
jgi:hypothetical protein